MKRSKTIFPTVLRVIMLSLLFYTCGIAAGQETNSAGSAPVQDQFSQLLAQFQNNPSDDGLRWKLILLAKDHAMMGVANPVPGTAKEAASSGQYVARNAAPDDSSALQNAIDDYQKAENLAPWWPDPYYNCAGVQELAGQLNDAIQSLHWYLMALPGNDEKDKDNGQAKIGEIEGEAQLKGASLSQSQNAWTPLVWAARWGYWTAAHALIASGENVNEKDSNNNTPLDYAMQQNNPSELNYLLAHGGNVNEEDSNNNTPLDYAARQGDTSELNYLLAHGGSDYRMDDTNLLRFVAQQGKNVSDWGMFLKGAVLMGDIDSLNLMIAHGADMNARNNALMWAVAASPPSIAIVQALLKAGASANAADSHGNTALMQAVYSLSSSIDIIQALIKAGANVNAADSDGNTVLMHAVNSCSIAIVQALLKAGANVNVADSDGNTVLMHAVDSFSADIVEALLKAGADVNATNSSDNTPLTLAVGASAPSIDIIQALIKAGANVNVLPPNGNGRTLLMEKIADDFSDLATIQLLIKAGADVNATNDYSDYDNKERGWTPLEYAFNTSNPNAVGIIQALISAGADVNVDVCQENYQGWTLSNEPFLFVAALRNQPELVKSLADHGADLNGALRYTLGSEMQLTPSGDFNPRTSELKMRQIIKLLVGNGADANFAGGPGDMTLLQIACNGEDFDLVKVLVDHGADINRVVGTEFYSKDTPIKIALDRNDYSIVKYLVMRGADATAKGSSQSTPVELALSNKDYDMVGYCLKHGVSSAEVWDDFFSQTNLTTADAIQSLIKAGAGVNAIETNFNLFGDTPLINAMYYINGHRNADAEGIVGCLIANGAKLNVRNDNGDTALDDAIQENEENVVQILEKAGAKRGHSLRYDKKLARLNGGGTTQ